MPARALVPAVCKTPISGSNPLVAFYVPENKRHAGGGVPLMSFCYDSGLPCNRRRPIVKLRITDPG
jgi:hypothetical protein